jgi:hypothetical protein
LAADFQVVSPNITIPGGAAIVLSSILYASRSQLDNAARQAAEQKARDAAAQLLAARTEAANILLDPPIPAPKPRRPARKPLKPGLRRKDWPAAWRNWKAAHTAHSGHPYPKEPLLAAHD